MYNKWFKYFYDLISDLAIKLSSDYHSDLNHGTGECSSRASGENKALETHMSYHVG